MFHASFFSFVLHVRFSIFCLRVNYRFYNWNLFPTQLSIWIPALYYQLHQPWKTFYSILPRFPFVKEVSKKDNSKFWWSILVVCGHQLWHCKLLDHTRIFEFLKTKIIISTLHQEHHNLDHILFFFLVEMYFSFYQWSLDSGLVLFLKMRKVRSERSSTEMWKVTAHFYYVTLQRFYKSVIIFILHLEVK